MAVTLNVAEVTALLQRICVEGWVVEVLFRDQVEETAEGEEGGCLPVTACV